MAFWNKLQAAFRSLSARLLVLTLVFVMLAEVLIFVPSIAFFRLNYLEKKVDFAHIATLSLLAAPDNVVSEELREELLFRVGARSVVLHGANSRLLILRENMPYTIDAEYNLAEDNPFILIEDAFATLFAGPGRIIRILSPIENEPNSQLEVVIDEAPLIREMYRYAGNIFWGSLLISTLAAVLVYFALHRLMVQPMRRLSESMSRFRRAPEAATTPVASGRRDEIGIAEREFDILQTRLRAALKQKQHLVALGTAVTKISHDLRNILSTSQILSDSLAEIEDPKVQKIVPRLMTSIDRAIELCTQTLKFGRADEREPRKERFLLESLVNEVRASVGLKENDEIEWKSDIPVGMMLNADREQFYRILLNLCRNAVQAMEGKGALEIQAARVGSKTLIRIIDTGPGLHEKAQEHLFEPFSGSVRAGGTGLGLSIVRELVVAHGGEIELERTGPSGTVFRIEIPN